MKKYNPPFFKRPEAARYLGIGETTLRRWEADGTLPPAATIGDETRSFGFGLKQSTGWPKPVLDRWIAEREKEQAS